MKLKGKILRYFIGIFCVFSLFMLAQKTLTQGGFFIQTFNDFALTIDVPDAGPIIGETDVEVRHPFWVSARPTNAPPLDPADPSNIAAAWLTETFTNMRDLNGQVVVGATLDQEWVAVSIQEAINLFEDGYAVIGSSGGFMFALIKQTASSEATAAFGFKTIDNGEYIRAVDTVQGICG